MKRNLLTAATLAASIGAGTMAQAGIIDVNLTRSGGPTEAGFTNWEAADNAQISTLSLVESGLTLSVVASNNDGASPANIRSIDRADTYDGTLDNLTETWWGARASASVANPGGFFTIDIAGLSAGNYTFKSWHHDQGDQTGTMKIEVSTDNGGNFTEVVSEFDIVSNDSDSNVGAPNEQTFAFTAIGDDIQVRFTNVTSNDNGTEVFAIVNGFSIVPEPSSLALLGLGGLLIARRRRG